MDASLTRSFKGTNMAQGFQDYDATKIAVIIKRLTPAIEREDEVAVGRGLREAIERYGEDVVNRAWEHLLQEHEWLISHALSHLSQEQRQTFHDSSYEIIAEQLTEAGLRLEDNFRVLDNGFVLTKAAIAAIKTTGFSAVEHFGSGVDSLAGVGIRRDPFKHPLSEVSPDGEHMNLWMFASIGVSAALDWLSEPPDNPQVAINNIQRLVFAGNPAIDFEKLLRQCRYDDRALMKLASLIKEGFEQVAKREPS
jgi:hypothetical protein